MEEGFFKGLHLRQNPIQKLKSESAVYKHLTGSSGINSTVRDAEGLSAHNTQGRQDEEDE